ncbi:hypothetical protein EON81_04980 [bacterium]|nr:MAG: hypothetical protein EON81_04980 [bacterium]
MDAKQATTNQWLLCFAGILIALIVVASIRRKSVEEGLKAVGRWWPLCIVTVLTIMVLAPIFAGARTAADRYRSKHP